MKNNITLINPYVWKNFFDVCPSFSSVNEMRESFEKFVSEHKSEINAINERIENGEIDSINEEFGYVDSEQLITEASLGKRKHQVQTDTDDVFAPDSETTIKQISGAKPASTLRTKDDIEAANANKNITIIKKKQPDLIDTDVKVVRNVDYDSTSMNDIHYCVQSIYQKLLNNKKNYEVITPISLLDTEAVTEMDALFAFMDLPNINISTFVTDNVTNMEGMFYKSTFNNDSIQNWDVSKVDNMRNMFNGCSMTNPAYIANWYPNTKNHALPKLGIGTSDDELDTDAAVDKLFGSEDDIKRKFKARMGYEQNESYHVMSSSEFIAEGKFGDFINKNIQKLKKTVSDIRIKLANGMRYVFDSLGHMFDVITPKAALEYVESHNIAGVTNTQNYKYKEGYYEEIEKGDTEYNNYLEFFTMLKNKGGGVNEARVAMSSNKSKAEGAAAPNINADDWNTSQLIDYIEKEVVLTQKRPGRTKQTLVVWGAPGIGKTSIPKTLISELNKQQGRVDEKDKMTVLVADCSMMTSDGFSLPIPGKAKDVSKLISSNAEAARIAKENNMSIEELASIDYTVSDDAPKTWLPVYKPTGDRKKDAILNALANGATQPVKDENGDVIGFEKTGSGGILFIDEFLRADRDIFFIVCQLMLDYKYGQYVLGDKWQIVAASNRPTDDNEVRTNFVDAAGAGLSRLAACNFVPSFTEWRNWAEKHGFDETTLSFIAGKPFDGNDSRWHNFDPELKRTNNETLFVTPRSWTMAINELKDECEFRGYKSYAEIPKSKFRSLVGIRLPERIAQEYTDYYFMNNAETNPYTYDAVVKNPNIKVKNTGKYKCAAAAETFTTTIQLRYNRKNPIPVDDFANLMQFLCDNYKADANVIYSNFYEKVCDICSIVAPEGATQEEIDFENSYDKVGDIFANAFPEYLESL